MHKYSDLQEQRVVLLGGTSGIGLATAKAAAREGAAVVVVSSRQSNVDKALLELPKGSEGYAVNLSNEEHIRNFFARVPSFDHLVYSAGDSLVVDHISNVDVEAAKQAFTLRYWGAYTAVKYGSGKINPGGSITLTTGIAGERPMKEWTIASSVCGAVTSLTRALAVELAPIRVNAVSPGVVRTELWRGMSETERQDFYNGIGQNLLVGRVGEVEDLAEAYLFLMREKFSTGQILTVDGGTVLV
ncbi:SDR family oxidoreductase [Cohnella lupini]|uniref:NAD(P)-dependent dehydrogenase (Short-subunit alcohol dehydrogenase family) n=1 Tax=Cohnella lupini TaxID=1294267 RepID=A0A3D9HTT4_9BACL|nr:SDR family oxidoreductase [Cohnella lupini]RED52835.1 NAD(P)-dependent dehydrogenase (short-subunit alcohol dehydrogenase family) [Cohnella lupini]